MDKWNEFIQKMPVLGLYSYVLGNTDTGVDFHSRNIKDDEESRGRLKEIWTKWEPRQNQQRSSFDWDRI